MYTQSVKRKLIPMSFHATLEQIISVLQASSQNLPDGSLIATCITTDSRNVKPGEIFLALRGEKFDGHDFVKTAIAQGAIAAIVDTKFDAGDLPVIVVPDTLVAYQAIGHWWRTQFKIPIIAITGSVGKTTTKELIAVVLSKYGKVHKTQANYNNEIGVPKTLLELNQDHDFAVVEMGMRAPGEIALLSQIASPDISVITNVGTAHIGILGSRTAIAHAKCELLAEMPKDSIAILNYENPLLLETAKTVWQGKSMTFVGMQARHRQQTQWIAREARRSFFGCEAHDIHPHPEQMNSGGRIAKSLQQLLLQGC